MSARVSELTVAELEEVIEDSVRRALREMLTDPDVGLELRPAFAASLVAEAEAEDRGDTELLEVYL